MVSIDFSVLKGEADLNYVYYYMVDGVAAGCSWGLVRTYLESEHSGHTGKVSARAIRCGDLT